MKGTRETLEEQQSRDRTAEEKLAAERGPLTDPLKLAKAAMGTEEGR